MLKRMTINLIIAGIAVNLAGCATLQKHNFAKKRRTEYLHSQDAAPLQVPAGLNASGVGDDYSIPPSAMTAAAKPIGLLPPDSLADKLARGVVTKAALQNASKIADSKPAAVVSQPAIVASANQGIPATAANNVLPLNKTMTQAWKPVGTALKRAGYRIAVQDDKLERYYILDIHATDEIVTKATPIYQVRLASGADGNAYAYVVDQDGNPVNAIISQCVLTNLSNALAGKGPSSFTQMLAPVKRWFKEAF